MCWVPIKDLDKYKAFPTFLKEYFGKEHLEIEHVEYIYREGAYVILIQDNKVGIIQTPKGFFLPGGGLENEESILRIENRVKKGGHNIPDADVVRRFDKCFEDLMTILPYCDEATFYDNENGFVAVAEYKNGEIMQIGNLRPQWLCI